MNTSAFECNQLVENDFPWLVSLYFCVVMWPVIILFRPCKILSFSIGHFKFTVSILPMEDDNYYVTWRRLNITKTVGLYLEQLKQQINNLNHLPKTVTFLLNLRSTNWSVKVTSINITSTVTLSKTVFRLYRHLSTIYWIMLQIWLWIVQKEIRNAIKFYVRHLGGRMEYSEVIRNKSSH
jgi:hypothetical protein